MREVRRRKPRVQLSGKGKVYSYQIMHDYRIRLMQEYQPFIIAVVEVDSPSVAVNVS